MPIPVPIVVTVTAVPDPNDPGKLNLSLDKPDTIYLSLLDDDQLRWVCNDGDLEVRFGPAANPFVAGPVDRSLQMKAVALAARQAQIVEDPGASQRRDRLGLDRDVRRAKLYYLRERSGKSARIKEKLMSKASAPATAD